MAKKAKTLTPDIRIGTLVSAGMDAPEYISQILPHGFESFSLTFWQTCEASTSRSLRKR